MTLLNRGNIRGVIYRIGGYKINRYKSKEYYIGDLEMISNKDIVGVLSSKGVDFNIDDLDRKGFGYKGFIDRLVCLINSKVFYGSDYFEIRDLELRSYLGRFYRDRMLIELSSDLDNKGTDKESKFDRHFSKETSIFNSLFTRYKRGYNFSRNDNIGNNKYSISQYMINKDIFDLYKKNRDKAENKTFINYIQNVIKNDNKETENTEKKDIIERVKIKLDKKFLIEYFSNYKRYQVDIMINEIKDIHHSKDTRSLKLKLISEIEDFRKSDQKLKKYISSKTNSFYNVEYTQSASGRYYSWIGGLNKNIRKHLLKDFIEIDLDTSAPNCLYRTYQSLTDKQLKYIETVINEKQKSREHIGNIIFQNTDIEDRIKIKSAKSFITSLFFGAGANEYGNNATNDLLNEIAKEYNLNYKELKERFYNSKFTNGLITETKQMMDAIYKEFLLKNYNKEKQILRVNNSIIKIDKAKVKSLQNSLIAMYYQNWESNFLIKETEVLRNRYRIANNYLMLHDAIYINKHLLIKKDISENDIRNEFRKIRVKGNDFIIKPII